MSNRFDSAKKLIEINHKIFKCPVCGREMAINRTSSLQCKNGHNFDLARHGYVNMLLKPVRSDYDQKMFESRSIIIKSGFFDPLLIAISDLILEKHPRNALAESKILDAGCGEGSHLAKVLINLGQTGTADWLGIGVDISKEAILTAAKEYPNMIWSVADLAKLPFKNDQFDIVLNILSPANYGEFKRVLKKGGLLIKAVPGDDYLIELREILFKDTVKQSYHNDRVIRHFSANINLIDERRISANICLNSEQIEHLIRMTPLAWHGEKAKIDAIIETGTKSITVAFDILVGIK